MLQSLIPFETNLKKFSFDCEGIQSNIYSLAKGLTVKVPSCVGINIHASLYRIPLRSTSSSNDGMAVIGTNVRQLAVSQWYIVALLLFGQPAFVTCVYRLFTSKMLNGLGDFVENFQNGVTSSDCKKDLLYTWDRATEDLWALKMWDAWAKPQTGILTGNSMHLGNFDECLSVNYRGNTTEIQGQYCSVFINPNNDDLIDFLITNLHGTPTNPSGKKSGLVNILDKFRLSWGICIPTSCSRQNLMEMWGFTKNYFNHSWDIEIKDDFCDYEGKHQLSDFAYFTIIVLGVLCSVAVAGTLYHIYLSATNKTAKEKPKSFLMEFSLYSNVKKILSTKTNDPLQCLNAVRVLSLFWIIVRHYFMLIFYFPHLNSMDLNEWKGEYGNMFILSGSMAVDSFFTASGITVAYLFMKNRETEDSFSLFHYYMHKLLKVMPTLVLVVLLYASLLAYLGNGPFWPIIYNLFQKDCENNWWSTITFMANYIHPTNHCLTQGWYLSVDIQLFFLSPLLLLPLLKWPKATIIGTSLLIIASLIQCFIESWTMNLGSTHFDENAFFHANIVATHIRAPCWLIGFIMGYFLYKLRDDTIRLKPSTVIIFWSASLFVFLIIILGHETVATSEYNVIRSSLFNTLVRPSWSIALCWVIFASMKGYGGVANKILTAPIFNIIIKINFNMFLLHVLPQIYFIGQTRMSTYFNNAHNMYLVLADLAGALVISFVWTLIVEPWIWVMESVYFDKKTLKEQKICTISLLQKENSEKFGDLKYVTNEKALLNENGTSERDNP
ncbi:hypothetical protein Trydic_g8955 [Trypoxylus dichotomus]